MKDIHKINDIHENEKSIGRHIFRTSSENLNNRDLFTDNKPGEYFYEDIEGLGKTASGVLCLVKDPKRNKQEQKKAGGSHRRSSDHEWGPDDGGHLIAAIFGGAPDAKNLIAQNRNINRGAYKIIENEWKKHLINHEKVFVHIEAYSDDRPTSFMGYAIYEDKKGKRTIEYYGLTNESLQIQEVWSEVVGEIEESPIINKRDSNRLLLNEEGEKCMKKSRGFKMSRGKYSGLGYDELKENVEEIVGQQELSDDLVKRFIVDKEKIEERIERVQNSKIPEEEKSKFLSILDDCMNLLQLQYEDEVTAEQEKLQEEMQFQLEQMDEAAEEFDNQLKSLNDVSMDVASVTMDKAINEAEEKKQDFVNMRNEYTEKLNRQIEQANMLRRQILSRRMNGK